MPTNPRDFDDFIEPGFVSVWVGDFRSQDDYNKYRAGQFESEFGFNVRSSCVKEARVEAEALEIGKLVDGFSQSKTFDSKVVETAQSQGITLASCMFIIYHFKYETALEAVPSPRMKFVGAIPFPGFG